MNRVARRWAGAGLGIALLLAVAPEGADATVEMQRQARKLGYTVENCHYCHAGPAAVKKMAEQAKKLGYNEHNCVYCHGNELPAALNDRGMWLLAEKNRRQSDGFDMAWLKDYVPPTPTPTPN